MNRANSIEFLDQNTDYKWDVIVIGGGATGLGVAMDTATRGYKTLLLEQSDFTKGTSSRSTKLVHGGVRYLAQGDIKLVLEALHERGLLLKNAPHLCDNQTFIIPAYSWMNSLFYVLGLKIYDLLAGKLSLGKSKLIGHASVVKAFPTIQTKHLHKGILYHDGQFDDARLGINIAQTCTENGGHAINYMKVEGLGKNGEGKIDTVFASDIESGQKYVLHAKAVVNATGVFVDDVLAMDEKGKMPMVRPSQGTHLVLDKSFLPSQHALMIPKTPDGRVLFAVPWHNKLVVGTTDTKIEDASLEPRALSEEVDFILNTFGQYVTRQPTRSDVLSVFSGLRPLARPQKEGKNTKEISRDHKLMVSKSGLITITGGKWTTFRKMAEDTVDKAIEVGNLPPKRCITKKTRIHGYTNGPIISRLRFYGSDAATILSLENDKPEWAVKLHPSYPYTKAEVIWAVRHEMARTVEDVLARRLRILFLDARASLAMATDVANLMATEMKKDAIWIEDQLRAFEKTANNYLL